MCYNNGIGTGEMIMKNRIVLSLVAVLIIIFACPLAAYADTGPSPSLKITIKNPPPERYCFDLLIKVEDISDERKDRLARKTDDRMIQGLYEYTDEGWYPAINGGFYYNGIYRLFGNGEGEAYQSDIIIRSPDEFKIIIVTESGEILVSNLITKKNFFSEVVFNAQTGRASENRGNGFAHYPLTLMVTLVIEGLILLLFRFRLRDNWKPFLLVNIGTQGLLYITVWGATLAFGYFYPIIAYHFAELAIIAIERSIYLRTLKWRNDERAASFKISTNSEGEARYVSQRERRITAYAIVANLASWLIGWFLLYEFLSLVNRIFI